MSEAGYLSILADAQRRVGRLTDAAATCERGMQLVSEGSRWLEPELCRVQAVIAADLTPTDFERRGTPVPSRHRVCAGIPESRLRAAMPDQF
jgi:hypothetical protein